MNQKDTPIIIPQALPWLVRIASDERLSTGLLDDPLAFSLWYAQIGELLPWPEEIVEIQTRERGKKRTLEHMLKLLSQMNYVFNGTGSASHAKRILEGYSIHAALSLSPQTLSKAAKDLSEKFPSSDVLLKAAAMEPSFSSMFMQLCEVLELSRLERDILAFAFLSTASDEIAGLFRQLSADRWMAPTLWRVIFDTTKEDLARAMRAQSALRLSGLLKEADRKAQLVRVSRFWVDLLSDSTDLFEAILEPLDRPPGGGMPARLLAEDLELASSILANANENGVNLLLYGASSLEKHRLIRELIGKCGRKPWRVRTLDGASRYDKPALTYVAFKLLAKQDKNAMLVVEHPSEVLDGGPPDFLKALFGIELDNEGVPEFDEHLLSTNPVPGLWLAAGAGSLPDETCARFVFHAPLKKADRATRVAALDELVRELDMSLTAREEVLKLEGVSSAQVQAAAKAARLSGKEKPAERDAAIVQAIKRSQRALNRDMQPKAKECVTQYSLRYLNAAGRFGPAEILDAFRRNPKGTLLLYGIPGTGKTQFAEYIASELGLPLITRSAADLLSKWLGESEKNIAKAFEDAANEDGILFLDEGDSFLRNRQEAKNSWEITQVNELLQHMERFQGIVIVATNLFRGLDPASIRRFTFKLEFKELDVDQRWEMFLNETGLTNAPSAFSEEQKEAWSTRLTLMHHLTAGDFATVKRQSLILGMKLSPEEYLQQLELETKLKRQDSSGRELM